LIEKEIYSNIEEYLNRIDKNSQFFSY